MAKKKIVEKPEVKKYEFTYHAVCARSDAWDADWSSFGDMCDEELQYSEKCIREAVAKGEYSVRLCLYNRTRKFVIAKLREKGYYVKLPSLFSRFLSWVFGDDKDNNTRYYTVSWERHL